MPVPTLGPSSAPELAEVNQRIASATEAAQLKWQAFDAARKGVSKRLDNDEIPEAAELKSVDAIREDYHAAAKDLERLQSKRDGLLTAYFESGGATGGLGKHAATKASGKYLMEAKSLMTTTGVGQAVTPVEQAPYFFDLLAAQSIGIRSGFTVLPITGHSLKVPRLLTDVGASWVNEGDPIPEGDPTGDQITVTPQKIGKIVAITREAFNDSNPAALAIAEHSLVRSIALTLDKGFYEGSGTTPEIKGLKNTSGIGVIDMGANGAAFTNAAALDPILQAIGALAAVNAEATAIAMHPSTWTKIASLKAAGTGEYMLEDEPYGPGEAAQLRLFGVPVYLSSQISTTETQGTSGPVASSIYVYDAAQVLAVRRQDSQVDAYPYYKFQNDMWGVRVTARWDVALPYPQAVVRIRGVL